MRLLVFGFIAVSVMNGQKLDPHDLIERINAGLDVDQIWKSFGIAPSEQFRCNSRDCQAESLPDGFNLALSSSETVVIQVTQLSFSRFLVFRCDPMCAYIDHVDRTGRYMAEPPTTAAIVAAREKRWFVVTGNTGGGSGARSSGAEWYELVGGNLHQVLTVPDRGYMAESDPATTFSMRFVR
jgi:hypothetical protein